MQSMFRMTLGKGRLEGKAQAWLWMLPSRLIRVETSRSLIRSRDLSPSPSSLSALGPWTLLRTVSGAAMAGVKTVKFKAEQDV